MINALLLLVLAAGVFFCDYSTNQAKHHVSVTAKCLSTDLLYTVLTL